MRLIDADALYKDITSSIDYCEDVLEIIDRQPTAEPEQRWIPVTERLPENNGNYLITHRLPWKSETGEDRYEVDMDYWQWDYWQRNIWNDDNDVVAWMPLPEPWEGADNE